MASPTSNTRAKSIKTVTKTAAVKTRKSSAMKSEIGPVLGPEMRIEKIRAAAYVLSEKRGFAPGHELEDWVKAEAAIDSIKSEKH